MYKWEKLLIVFLIFLVVLAIFAPVLKNRNTQKDDGLSTDKLEFKISQEKTVYYYDEPIKMNFSLENIGTTTLKVQPFVIYGNVLVNLTNSKGIRSETLIKLDFGLTPSDLITLTPNDTHYKVLDISGNIFIPPENYSISAQYISHGSWYSGELDDSWCGKPVSNGLNFQVINDMDKKIIFIQNNVSGFTRSRYDHFRVVLDTKEIYMLHIEERTNNSDRKGDNDIPEEEIEIIINKIKHAADNPSFSSYGDGYFVKFGKKKILSEEEYSKLLGAIEKSEFLELDDHYICKNATTCMGTIYFTARSNINDTYKTVSCYHNTSGAPQRLRDLEFELVEICKLKFY